MIDIRTLCRWYWSNLSSPPADPTWLTKARTRRQEWGACPSEAVERWWDGRRAQARRSLVGLGSCQAGMPNRGLDLANINLPLWCVCPYAADQRSFYLTHSTTTTDSVSSCSPSPILYNATSAAPTCSTSRAPAKTTTITPRTALWRARTTQSFPQTSTTSRSSHLPPARHIPPPREPSSTLRRRPRAVDSPPPRSSRFPHWTSIGLLLHIFSATHLGHMILEPGVL